MTPESARWWCSCCWYCCCSYGQLDATDSKSENIRESSSSKPVDRDGENLAVLYVPHKTWSKTAHAISLRAKVCVHVCVCKERKRESQVRHLLFLPMCTVCAFAEKFRIPRRSRGGGGTDSARISLIVAFYACVRIRVSVRSCSAGIL